MLALAAGQADWVRELAGQVLTLTSDPDLRIAARLNIGWSLLWSNRNAEALDTLISVAAEASPGAGPRLGRYRRWRPRSLTRPGFPKPAPRCVPLRTPSTP